MCSRRCSVATRHPNDVAVIRRLGLDLGGTNVKVAIIAEGDPGVAPEVLADETHPTYAERGPDAVVERLIEIGRAAIDRYGPVASVGVGVPGVFDPGAGTVLLFPNLPGPWPGHPLSEPLSEAFGVPVTLINDARAFTLAEGTIGAGMGCDTLVCLTLGTGVGGGVMIGGRLRLGSTGRAGEIGHQIVLPDGPQCGCGAMGCAEAVTRAGVLAELAGMETAEQVYAAAARGERGAIEAIDTVAGYLGIALANMVVVLGPDRIVIGGGIAVAGDIVLDPIRRAVTSRVTLVPAEAIRIVPAALGPLAGAIGAALAGRPLGEPGCEAGV